MEVGDLVEIERPYSAPQPAGLYIIISLAGMWSGYVVVRDASTGKQYQFLEHFIKPLTTQKT